MFKVLSILKCCNLFQANTKFYITKKMLQQFHCNHNFNYASRSVKKQSQINRVGVENTRLDAKAKDTKKIQGQGQPFRGQTLSRPRTGMLEAKAKNQGHSRKCSPNKKRVFKNFFQAISKKKVLKKISQAISKKKKRSSQNFSRRSL